MNSITPTLNHYTHGSGGGRKLYNHQRQEVKPSVDKKYTEFMDEISADELYEGLLAYGFFAEKNACILIM